jgi:hypothetical protein
MTKPLTTADAKRCTRCGVLKPFKDFYTTPEGVPYKRCKVCQTKMIREREKARKAGGKKDKHGKEIGNVPNEQNLPSNPAQASYVSTVVKNATEMIASVRDVAFEMTDKLSKAHDVNTLSIKEAYQLAVSIKQLNDIILTNSLFLKNNIDLTSLSDDELLQLASAMTAKATESKAATEAEIIEVEVEK